MKHVGFETDEESLVKLEELGREVVTSICGEESRRAVEIGSWVGGSAMRLLGVFEEVYCVDTWEGSLSDVTRRLATEMTPEGLFARFCENVGDRLYRGIVPCFGSSARYAAVWPMKMGLVFIDGDHTEAGCMRDIRMWWGHVGRGGVMCGHDWDNGFPGVEAAVEGYFGGRRAIEHEGKMWWVRRE